MKISTLYLTTMLSIIFSCKSIEVSKTSLDNATAKGAVYKLPKTQLLFEISIKTITYEKNPLGCFDAYKDVFKGTVDKKLITKLSAKGINSIVTSKISSAVISALPITDRDKIFSISTNNKFLHNRVYGLSIDDNGVLSKGEFSDDNQIIPVVSQIISSASNFISPFTTSRGTDNKLMINNDQTCDNLYLKYNQIDNQKMEFNSLTPFKLANQLPTKDLYERVLIELENEKSSLFNQLMFSTDIQLDKLNIRFSPSKDDLSLINGTLFFGFLKNASDEPEVYINSDLIGKSSDFVVSTPGVTVFSKTSAEVQKIPNIQLYFLKIVPDDLNKAQLSPIDKKPESHINPVAATNDDGGLYYNIPLSCKIYIQKGIDNNWSEAKIMLPQWGGLGRLSDKLTKQTIELNPLYGNLKSLQGESKTVPADQIKTLGESLSQARDVFYTDPITKMERRIKYLETKAKLSDAEGNELSELRKQKDLLQAQKDVLELKKALKEYEE